MNRFTFERKLSLDGVAIIAGVIAALLYIGQLQERIADLQKSTVEQTAHLADVSKSVDGVKNDVAVLYAVVVERTGKPIK